MAIEKEVVRFGPFAAAIANGVRVGSALYLSGQVSLDDAGRVVGAGDYAAQFRQVYANIVDVLSRFDATLDNVVDETVFVTDMQGLMSDFDQFVPVRREAYGGEPQVTQTMVEVAALAMPGLMVEIKCIAQL